MEGLFLIAKNSGWFMPFDEVCFISERHIELHRDELGRLHNLEGPAVRYPDGWCIYAIKGVLVTESIISKKFGIKEIDKESNSEIKRIMLELYGWDKYLFESEAKIIHKDSFGVLYRKEIKGDEDLVMVQVENSSKEGLWVKENNEYNFYPSKNEKGEEFKKKYTLRVPPHMKTAKEAVAWTFGMEANNYSPIKET